SWFTTRSWNTGFGGSAGREGGLSLLDSRASAGSGSCVGTFTGADATGTGEGASAGTGVDRGPLCCGRGGLAAGGRGGVDWCDVGDLAGREAGDSAVRAGASGSRTGSTVAVVSVGAIGDETATDD